MEVADILARKAKDPRVGWVTVTHVVVSADLSHAKIYISLPQTGPKEEREALKGLKNAAGFIRSELARRLPLRRVPDLIFFPDREAEQTTNLLALLEQLSASEGEEKEPC